MKYHQKHIFLISYLFLFIQSMTAYTFKAGKSSFLMNNEPYVVKAAELHYPRIPRPYWEHRIKMVKALGMNTVCLYVFWNVHESKKGHFDFTGQNDLRAFVELCKKNELNVILRPGPYVCAEWEMGGLPWWLLEDNTPLRTDDSEFLEYVERFETEVARQLKGLTAKDGGPVIMVQVENEYGSYDTNPAYISKIRDMLTHLYGPEMMLFQCDWSSNFTNNALPDLLWTLNFGTGADIKKEFEPLLKLRKESPLMCSEYWSGWFDKWGASHETRPALDMVAGIDTMLANNISFSLYMTHGGTNWGHWAGANSPGFAPDVTSYDYDAPINEWGAPTQKYHILREVMARYSDTPLPDAPDTTPIMDVAPFTLDKYAPLWKNLPKPIAGPLATMEKNGLGYGSIIYRTILDKKYDASAKLMVDEPHDYAQIFLNGQFCGKLDRRLNEKSLHLPTACAGDTLDILVEAMGRINFGKGINDYKGITGTVSIEKDTLSTWSTYLLPDTLPFYKEMDFVSCNGVKTPGVYKGTMVVDSVADTFLDMSLWGKGFVYVNGHPLGRFWNIGPQQTLYLPGCWLNKGNNDVVVFDIIGPEKPVIAGLKEHLLNKLGTVNTTETKEVPMPEKAPAASIFITPGGTWSSHKLPSGTKGKYLAIKIDKNNQNFPLGLSELYLSRKGKRIDRGTWLPAHASSSEYKGNHTPDKIIDLQESTYWLPKDRGEQIVVISLGNVTECDKIEILPAPREGDYITRNKIKVYIYGE